MTYPISGQSYSAIVGSSQFPQIAAGQAAADSTFASAMTKEAGEAATPGAPAGAQSKKISDAAKQFEAMILAQILKSVQPEGDGGLDGDQSGSTMLQLGLEQFAQALTAHGGLGLAKIVEPHLQTALPKRPILR